MQALLIGDIHVRHTDVERTDVMFLDVISKAKEIKPDIMILMGDIYDEYEIMRIGVNRRVVDFLAALKEIAPLYLLVGNHDLICNSEFCTRNHSLAAYEYWPDVEVIWKPIIYNIKGYRLAMCPYVPKGRLEEALNLLGNDWKTCNAVFAHTEVKGVKLTITNVVSDSSDIWLDIYPNLYTGHTHEYSKTGKNVTSVGSVMQMKYGEGIEKSISLLTFAKNGSQKEKRLFTSVPCKIKMTLSVDEFIQIEEPDEEIVLLTIKDTDLNIQRLNKSKKMKRFISKGYIIKFKHISEEQKQEDEENGDDGVDSDDDFSLIERKVEDYDRLLFDKVNERDKNIRKEFKYLFPEIVDKFKG